MTPRQRIDGMKRRIIEADRAKFDLQASLKELVNLAEVGDADQDEQNWHPALERARALLTSTGSAS